MPRRRKNGLPTDFVQPISAPTGMEYGKNKKLREAQKAVPLPAPTPIRPGEPPDPVADATGWNPTDGITPMNAPSTRSWEPVTAGLPTGAGPGPEALGGLAPGSTMAVANTLQALAARTGDTGLMALAALARNQGV